MANSTSTPDLSGTASPIAASSSTASNANCGDGIECGEGSGGRGFVLVPVIWVVFLLALAMTSFSLMIRSGAQQTTSAGARAEAEALADAGVNLALQDLVNSRTVRSWQRRFPTDGRAYGCSIGESQLLITVGDEAGKVDLNSASEQLLRALLIGLGEPRDDASRLSAAVLDHRDFDDARNPGGAEAREYRAAGRLTGPKNAAFDSPLELAQVLGFDAAILARIMPHVTVHSGLSGIDPSKASPLLIDLLSTGSSGSARSPLTTASHLPAEFIAVSTERVLSINARAKGQRGGSFAREAIVRLATSRRSPYSIASWRQVSVTEEPSVIDRGTC